MNGKILGLDIGVASVGVGIIDKESGEIIHASSRIFPAATADSNVERRGFRQGRRLGRRKKHRKVRLADLFRDAELVTDFSKVSINLNPYELRVKGLIEKLTNEELFIALKNIVKRRGISYLDDANEDGESSSSEYGKAVEENRKLLADKTPGQIQLERFEKYGQVRGDFTIEENGEKHRLLNVFSTSAYKKEAERILTKQQDYNQDITDEFIQAYLTILTGKRKYYHGPGNEKSRTDYGRFRTDGTTLDNIFGILIGKCTFYPEEYRAAKASYTAQEFNLLNDLNNLTVPTETKKLSEEQKRQIIEYAKGAKTLGAATLLKYIAKLIDASVDDIKGYRIDKSEKPEMHTFDIYRKMQTLETVDVKQLSREVLDELAHILTLNTEREGIEEAIKASFIKGEFKQDQIGELVSFRKSNSSLFGKGWHNFSIKLMIELIPELYETSEEQMTILTRLGKQKTKAKSKRTKYIDEKELTEEIYNPVVAKSVRQAIKIINLATKKYGIFDNIVIEMARENNEEEAKKDYVKRQKANEDEKNAAMEKAAHQYNGKKELPDSIFHGHKELATKIRLWHQQGEKCLYTGKNIPIADLIENQYKYEIDHILPLSLSFDDSLANKVLVLATANQEKGQRTPFQALDGMDDSWSYREFKSYVKASKVLSNKKKDYLLNEEDINKIEVKQKFIERNLVDTRYSSRVVLNALQDFYKLNDFDTKISVVRGQFTSQLRRKWRIDKSRETYHHHAVDALIIAASSQLRLWKKRNNPLFSYKDNQFVDSETGEIITFTEDEYKELVFRAPYDHFVDTLSSKKFEDSILFSYQVDSKYNRKISDATIYATRKAKLGKDKSEETYVLGKIKDIYSQTGYDAFIKLYKKDKSKFLMYHKDSLTFEKVIEEILKTYPDREQNENGKEVACNPFEKYRQENGPIRKYSKKGKGPEIKSLKYYDNKLGNHIDITPDNSENQVILQSLSPWRTDVYFNPETEKYELLGLKYADLQFEKGSGNYSITLDKYYEIKEKEGVSEQSEFKFTLYKNDLLLIKDTKTKEQQMFRFLSRTMPNQKHYVELKPYDKAKFEGNQPLMALFGNVAKGGQCLKGLNKADISIYKVQTDVLGNKRFIKKEGDAPKLEF
ncbi:type II CRISPR RNA-guided endonuclease Cas9 [Streptococcus sanguinis]|uniref:type II CRISPR RNA-guided endonuclease Cas9 n=2 Tax=Streptococcus sanguinis TaxID=1305 RepID=UPI001CBB9D95|nr:type II CRISPR RNA-guided endonuclease Cas9 [Streptococcus sanguinis]MBZ2072524.1 type II CRISPR RNA-guided endonuclease Cas9 [Streptococcus sanguinis]MBZ2080513.1 type II CRISPR RNA-guided endonuclease Cas9 [Streptococcus sanguinis]MCC3164816.1 HNH endonuclease family protein [Streptococcus sanguinis]